MSLSLSENPMKTLSDAWDFRGRPADRSGSGGWASAAMILGIEAVERLTTLGIGVNLVTYLTGTMHLGNAAAANTVTNFLGTSFMLCLLGGFVADTFLGRYLTIAIFATIQATGVTILTLSTVIPSLRPPKCNPSSEHCVQANGTQLLVLYLALYLTALGTGGVKASVSGFGSDQFDETDQKERSQMNYFFNRFFFCINVGSLGAVTVLVYIQDDVGRKWGYGICACAIVFSLLIFLLGTKRYRFKKLIGSPITQIATVLLAALKKRRLELPSDPAFLYDVDDVVTTDGSKKMKQRLPHSKQFRCLDKAAIKEEESTVGPNYYNKWTLSTLTDVEEVKQIVRMLPIWATCILFYTVHAQLTTMSVAQAETMDRSIGNFQIPPASMAVFYVGSLLLTTVVCDRLVIRIARKLLKNPNGLSSLQRMGLGLFFSILAMSVAGIVENKRLRTAGSHTPASEVLPLSVFLLFPQYFFVGVGEALLYTGQLDFFLRECPKGMKTMSTGLLLSTLALGFFFSSVLVAIVNKMTGHTHPWIADNLNDGQLYDFYWLIAGLCVLNFLAFLAFAKWYEYKDKRLAAAGIELEEDPEIATCHA